MPYFVGIDSRKFEIGLKKTRFEALLGAAITVKNENEFNETYDECIDKILNSHKIKKDRLVYKSADLARVLPFRFRECISEIIHESSSNIHHIDIFYTRYNTKKIPYVSIHGIDEPKKVHPVEFLRIISSGYPHLCAWKYCQSCPDPNSITFYLDSFESDITHAWNEIRHLNIKVLYRGDRCNRLISLSDLLARLVDETIGLQKINLNTEGIDSIFCQVPYYDKIEIHDLGGQTDILKHAAPNEKKPIDLDGYFAHPIIFIPLESPGDIIPKEEREMFENLPIFSKSLDFACKNNGSLKYFRPSDSRIMKDGDYFLIMGEKGQSQFDYLNKGGLRILSLTPRDL